MPGGRDRTIYSGRLISLNLETVRLPNGRPTQLEVVRHPGGAVAAAVDEADRVCLLKQYRHAVGEDGLWELPAGCIDAADPTPLDTAQRELEEEAGVRAARWRKLGSILTSPGFCDEVLHLFLAEALSHVASRQDEDEVIEVHWIDLDEAVAMAAAGEIVDAKSVAALFRAERVLKGVA